MSSFAKSVLAAGLLCAVAGVGQAATRADSNALRADASPEIGAAGAINSGKLSFSLHNPGRTSLFLLRWQTPLQGLSADLFDVRLNGEAVRYIGPAVKRAAPTADDYLEIAPGETLRATVDLGANYDMGRSGMYEVRFKGQLEQSFGEREEHGRLRIDAVQNLKLAAPTSYLWVDGNQAQLAHQAMLAGAPVTWSGDVDAAIGFSACSTSQQNALPNALSQALTYATNGSNYLNAGTAGARYTTWFGTYDATRYNTVKSHFAAIKSALGTKPIVFDCSCTDSGTYAYVYPTQPYKIYVCGAFWSAPNAGTDSRGGTIVHETSHFDVVAGTDDLAYGQTAAKRLAQKTPSKAIRNADSHEYFGENTPAQN